MATGERIINSVFGGFGTGMTADITERQNAEKHRKAIREKIFKTNKKIKDLNYENWPDRRIIINKNDTYNIASTSDMKKLMDITGGPLILEYYSIYPEVGRIFHQLLNPSTQTKDESMTRAEAIVAEPQEDIQQEQEETGDVVDTEHENLQEEPEESHEAPQASPEHDDESVILDTAYDSFSRSALLKRLERFNTFSITFPDGRELVLTGKNAKSELKRLIDDEVGSWKTKQKLANGYVSHAWVQLVNNGNQTFDGFLTLRPCEKNLDTLLYDIPDGENETIIDGKTLQFVASYEEEKPKVKKGWLERRRERRAAQNQPEKNVVVDPKKVDMFIAAYREHFDLDCRAEANELMDARNTLKIAKNRTKDFVTTYMQMRFDDIIQNHPKFDRLTAVEIARKELNARISENNGKRAPESLVMWGFSVDWFSDLQAAATIRAMIAIDTTFDAEAAKSLEETTREMLKIEVEGQKESISSNLFGETLQELSKEYIKELPLRSLKARMGERLRTALPFTMAKKIEGVPFDDSVRDILGMSESDVGEEVKRLEKLKSQMENQLPQFVTESLKAQEVQEAILELQKKLHAFAKERQLISPKLIPSELSVLAEQHVDFGGGDVVRMIAVSERGQRAIRAITKYTDRQLNSPGLTTKERRKLEEMRSALTKLSETEKELISHVTADVSAYDVQDAFMYFNDIHEENKGEEVEELLPPEITQEIAMYAKQIAQSRQRDELEQLAYTIMSSVVEPMTDHAQRLGRDQKKVDIASGVGLVMSAVETSIQTYKEIQTLREQADSMLKKLEIEEIDWKTPVSETTEEKDARETLEKTKKEASEAEAKLLAYPRVAAIIDLSKRLTDIVPGAVSAPRVVKPVAEPAPSTEPEAEPEIDKEYFLALPDDDLKQMLEAADQNGNLVETINTLVSFGLERKRLIKLSSPEPEKKSRTSRLKATTVNTEAIDALNLTAEEKAQIMRMTAESAAAAKKTQELGDADWLKGVKPLNERQ